jgi:hypothetical protein
MTKFNLKKAILENKSTFFSSLTEGQFSWITQDTNQQIGSENENTLPFVYMFDNKGNKFLEKNYEGYGVFGDKDYYELLDQMNGGTGDRSRGINLAFDKEPDYSGEVLHPALVVNPNFNWKSHDFTEKPEDDPNQSWYQEEEEDDYNLENYDEDDDEDDDDYLQEASADSTPYGNYINKARAKSHLTKKDGDVYGIDESGKGHKITDSADLDKYTKFTIKSKELNEGKMYYHVLEDMGYGEIGHEGVYDTEEEAQDRANNLSRTYPDSEFYVEASTSDKEPYNVTYSDYDPNLDIDEGKKEIPIDEELLGFPNVDINFPTLKTRYIAKKFAEYMSNKEGQSFTVTLNSPDGPSFDLDLDGEKYDGGSYLIAKNGDIINVALRERPVYGNISMLDETEKPKTKMKKSELEKTIKEMILSEYEKNVNITDESPENEEDFLAEVAAILAEADKEADKDEETDTETTDTETADAEIETPEGTEDVEVTDTTTTDQVDPNVKAVQDALTQAQAAAQTLGDAKLTDQIGNTITFFTRTHVVDKGAVAEGEEMGEGKIEEGAFNDLLNKMESNTRIAADILTVITLAKEDKEGNAEEAVQLLMKNHDLSEEEALEAVTRIFKKAFEWVDSVKEGKKESYSGKSDQDFLKDIENQRKNYQSGFYNQLKNKEYYKDAESDDAEHINALEKDMEDNKDSSMKIKEVVFPMWQRIK